MLPLTSASTAVKLDHCDANLRRSLNPGEELWSVSLIEGAQKGWSVAPRGGGGRRGENMMMRRGVRAGSSHTENHMEIAHS